MKSIKTLLLALMGLASSLNPAFGQAGSLDSSFHEDGIVFFNFPGGNATAAAITVLPNEKILVAGTVVDGPGNDANILLLRFNPDGSLDPSFGNGGFVQYNWGEQHDFAQAMTVQQDGKILVSAYTLNGEDKANALLIRFKEDGDLDNSFNQDGVLYNGNQLGNYRAMKVFEQQAGKILWCMTVNNFGVWIGGYTENGDIDSTYGKSGIASFELTYYNFTYPQWSMLPDGGIIALGRSYDDTFSYYSNVFKYDNKGKLALLKISKRKEDISAVLSTDDALYIVGSKLYGEYNRHIAVARLAYDGNYATGYAANERLFVKTGGTDEVANALALHADGKLVVVGQDNHPTDKQVFVGRFDNDGEEDDQFGIKGWLKLNFSPRNDIAYATAIDADDRILVAGQSGDSLFVARLLGRKTNAPPSPGVDSTFFHFRPNPVGAAFTADYGLPTDGSFSLELMDALGRRVHRFYAQAPRQAGHYVEPIEVPAELPNGTYYIRFRSSDAGFLRKIILIR